MRSSAPILGSSLPICSQELPYTFREKEGSFNSHTQYAIMFKQFSLVGQKGPEDTKLRDITLKFNLRVIMPRWAEPPEAYGSRFVYVCIRLSVCPSVCLSAGFLLAR